MGDESVNSILESLTDKEKFKETVKNIENLSKEDRNKDKLHSSSLKHIKQDEKNPEKVLKKLNNLEEKGLDGYTSTKKLSRKEKKYDLWEKPFQKDNFNYAVEIKTYICPLGEILYRRRTYVQKQTKK